MTPKLSGALESLKKLQSFSDDEADKLTRRINDKTMPALVDAFKNAHATVDSTHSVVDEIDKFATDLKTTNGGDPLDYSEKQSEEVVQPRSSEVASR